MLNIQRNTTMQHNNVMSNFENEHMYVCVVCVCGCVYVH